MLQPLAFKEFYAAVKASGIVCSATKVMNFLDQKVCLVQSCTSNLTPSNLALRLIWPPVIWPSV